MDAATNISASSPPAPTEDLTKARLKVRQPLPDDSPWNAYEVAWFLGVSPSTVQKLEATGRLPANPRINRRIAWDPQNVKIFKKDPDHFKKGRARRNR